jgi:methyl-accepting chemotaxis protein
MRSISIKTGLTSLFALMILLIGALGYVAITKISATNDNVSEFARHYMMSIDELGKLNASLGDFRYHEGEHILSADAAEMADIEKDMAASEQEIKAELSAYEKVLDPEDVAPFKAFTPKVAAYEELHRTLLELSRANKHEESAVFYKGEMGTAYDELNKLIDEFLERERDGTKTAALSSAAEYAATLWQTFLVIGVGLALAIGAMAYSFFGVSKPIEQITRSMLGLAKGDTSKPIPFADRTNEIGAMAGAVQVFKDNMLRTREMESEAEASKARAETDRKRDMHEMADQFERAVGAIVTTVSAAATELQGAAQALSTSSSEASHQSTIVAAASEEAAANVRTVAAAAEELSGSVREISRQVSASATMAGKAVEEAQATNNQVGELSAGARKIGAIVDLINDIASKTNLLALNATIEAARAGEAGRGFAIVASEVKALAEQTSKATAEITGHISGVQLSTNQAATAILGISKTIEEISQITSSIAAAVEEQGAATDEIARNVDQAAQGTTQVTYNISGVNQVAEASGVSAQRVLSSATELSAQSARLSGEMDKFLATVRAA